MSDNNEIYKKYGIKQVVSLRGACEVILLKDKYLELVHAMYLTRLDWSAGFYRVQNALDRFEGKIEVEQDQVIFDNVSKLMDSEDGRVFLGDEYDEVLELVPFEIMLDFATISQHVDWLD